MQTRLALRNIFMATLLLGALAVSPIPVQAVPVFADFVASPGQSKPFTLGNVTGTVSNVIAPVPGSLSGGLVGTGIVPPSAGLSFNDPQPPANLGWQGLSTNIQGNQPNTVLNTFTVTFDTPVTDPTLHFNNLDSARAIFTGATDADGMAIAGPNLASSFSRVSGNNLFQTGVISFNSSNLFAANIPPRPAMGAGCNDNTVPGSVHGGACGSILLSGTYESFTWVETDLNPTASGDGHLFQLSADLDIAQVPEPATWLLLGMGLTGLAAWRRKSASA